MNIETYKGDVLAKKIVFQIWLDLFGVTAKKGDSVLIPDEEETSAKGEQEVEKNQKAASSNGKKESLTGYGVGWPLSESTSVND